MKTDDKLDKIPLRHPANQSDNIKDAMRLVATLTDQAKEAAEKNPLTSSGKLKSSLHGAPAITNAIKEEGIEAYKRGIVPEPNMRGGLKNNELNIAAKAALRGMELFEDQRKQLPKDDEEENKKQ